MENGEAQLSFLLNPEDLDVIEENPDFTISQVTCKRTVYHRVQQSGRQVYDGSELQIGYQSRAQLRRAHNRF
jgi:uncharacterized protein YlzI (FlbEa/FlbD family)